MPRNENGYVVRLSENATISILLNALEAYSVEHNEEMPFVETYGSLFGYQLNMQDERILFEIEMANIDTSAEKTADGVSANLAAMTLKMEMISSHWPHLEYLGDFHTHPYQNHDAVQNTILEPGCKKAEKK